MSMKMVSAICTNTGQKISWGSIETMCYHRSHEPSQVGTDLSWHGR